MITASSSEKSIRFIEFCAAEPAELLQAFAQLGLKYLGKHQRKAIYLFSQENVIFFANCETQGLAARHYAEHGVSIVSIGLQTDTSDHWIQRAQASGYAQFSRDDALTGLPFPTIIGPSSLLVQLFNKTELDEMIEQHFELQPSELFHSDPHLQDIDHIAINVHQGNIKRWSEFLTSVFEFSELSNFVIKTRTASFRCMPMGSGCGNIKIVVNEDFADGSQISDFLARNKGEGVQHIAFTSSDLPHTIRTMNSKNVNFVPTPSRYYDLIDARIPNHGEDVNQLKAHNILIDNDKYDKTALLLQVFTSELIGPIFFELIHRKGNNGFGEGNVKALFEAVEVDQLKLQRA